MAMCYNRKLCNLLLLVWDNGAWAFVPNNGIQVAEQCEHQRISWQQDDDDVLHWEIVQPAS
eukprot:6051467-Karenia_brevis.AAC.1